MKGKPSSSPELPGDALPLPPPKKAAIGMNPQPQMGTGKFSRRFASSPEPDFAPEPKEGKSSSGMWCGRIGVQYFQPM